MKKTGYTILILLFVAVLSGCKKDKKEKETENEQATIAKLQGTWQATKFTEKRYEVKSNKLVAEDAANYPANERSITYKGSEILYYRNGTLRNTYTYSIVDNEIRMKEAPDDFHLKLKFYSDTQHSHTQEYNYQSNGIDMKEVKETFYDKK